MKKSFLVCGLPNAHNGSEKSFIHCARELPTMQLPHVNETDDDPFRDEESDDDAESESDVFEIEDSD